MGTFLQDGATVLPPVKQNEVAPTGEVTEYAAGDVNQVREALLDLRTNGIQNTNGISALQSSMTTVLDAVNAVNLSRNARLANLGIYVGTNPPTLITYDQWVSGVNGFWYTINPSDPLPALPADWYVDGVNGNDINSGVSTSSAFRTLAAADAVVQPGQTVMVRGGTYTFANEDGATLAASGNAAAYITWVAYPGETVILDTSNSPVNAGSIYTPKPTVLITGSYLRFLGFHIQNSPNNLLQVTGANNVIIDSCVLHTGYMQGILLSECTHITIQNSEIYDCYDYSLSGNGHNGNAADGIAVYSSVNANGFHTIRNNIIHHVSDDGIDLSSQGANTVEGNVVYRCGYAINDTLVGGEGNGIKAGSAADGGTNTVRFNASYWNKKAGFCTGGAPSNQFYNNTSWSNGLEGFRVTTGSEGGYFRNNVSYQDPRQLLTGATADTTNSWNLGISNPLFRSIVPGVDGFLRLSASSPCRSVGAVITGGSTDLGAYPYEWNVVVLPPAPIPSLTYQPMYEKGLPQGYAGLDENGDVPASQIPDLSGTYQVLSARGQASGYASLGVDGKVPAAQLPDTGAGVYVPLSQVGANNGVAPLGNDGIVPADHLPAVPANPYDIVSFYPGVPADSAIVLRVVIPRTVVFPINATGSYANARVAATASTTLTLAINGTPVGTIVFGVGGTVGTWTFSAQQTVAAGDVLTITNQASADTTLADISITFTGTR